MKNFEMRCPFDGTSALQPEFNRVSAAGPSSSFQGAVPKVLARRCSIRTRVRYRLLRAVLADLALRRWRGFFVMAVRQVALTAV